MPIPWPPQSVPNEPGIATLSLGTWRHHTLQSRLEAAARAGYKWIDLFDECWAAYLEEHGLPGNSPWEPTADNLSVARKLGELVTSLGMKIACTQPLRQIEGVKDPEERRDRLETVAKRFPFMRAFGTDLVFMCANMRTDEGVTADLKSVARDLAELGDMAKVFAKRDGGPMLRIGYEGLSWARRNTWASTWEVVRMANRENVGLIIDAFNVLAVEFADPYHPAGHGRVHATMEAAVDVLCASMAGLVTSVPGEKIFFFQVGDAERMDPRVFQPPTDQDVPALLPWSRGHRLFPNEQGRGGYMPVLLVAAAVVATGYQGPLSLEVFNNSLNRPDADVPASHALRGMIGLRKLAEEIPRVPAFWEMWLQGREEFHDVSIHLRRARL
ncbi:xylose isomerase-like protein [Aspergillus avenaceus]|uniref:Xylose isomerase-like protein n=1 Tax=Aspergillus avenaceus TaxID=36643 RepID=A0A5N6U693_ASPAV|nr:xylose isomerase-like protein [Aspergillus avenaceus]